MSSTVNGIITQTQPYNSYGKICGDRECCINAPPNIDPFLGSSSCTNLNPSLCSLAGGVQPTTFTWVAPVNNNIANTNFYGGYNQVQCTYDISDFNTVEAVGGYISTFSTGAFSLNAPNWNDPSLGGIMQNFCASQTTQNCPINPYTGNIMPTCSNFVSQTTYNGVSASTLCNDWASSSSANTGFSNAAKNNYCNTFPTNQDCLCINAGSNPTFQEIQSLAHIPAPSQCWWGPCTAGQNNIFLVTPPPTTCPASVNVCLDIFNNINEGNNDTINFGNINIFQNCGTPPNTKPPHNTPTSEFWTKYGKIVIAILIVILALIIIVFIYRNTKNNKRRSIYYQYQN